MRIHRVHIISSETHRYYKDVVANDEDDAQCQIDGEDWTSYAEDEDSGETHLYVDWVEER